MKLVLIASLAAVLAFVPAAVAMWGPVPLEDLLKESDVIVVAKLTDVRKTKKQSVDYGSGTLTVAEILRGKAKAGDQLRWNGLIDGLARDCTTNNTRARR